MSTRMCMRKFISLYQVSISPFLGTRCRFYPSCSQYADLVLEKYPLFPALTKISSRLLRCHPWNAGGVDLP